MDQFHSEHEPAGGGAAASCPDESVWDAIRDTSGASADASFLDHVQACPGCLGRLEAMAARLSRDDLLTESGRGSPAGADTLVARLLENPPAADPRPPAPVIDGLEDMVEVGRGGMGIVYHARDTRLDRTVAVKVLSSAPALSAEARGRADREARLLARIAHPNIVRINSVTDAQGLPAIVMEWIDGESLDKVGRRGGLPIEEAVRIVRDLAGAVAAMHEAGIVHRDIKPANVLIGTANANGPGSGPGIPKLIDFGLARPDDEPGQAVTRAHVTLGTPAFMAPEQTGLDPALGPVGPATDIHGLGAILYWLLSGQVPYEGPTTAAVLKRAADGGVRPISTVVPRLPPDVGTIVAACLEREPARRYRSAAALADDLARFLDGRPIRARRAGILEQGAMWARRRPAAAAVAAAGLLVAVAMLAGIGHHLRSLARARAAVAAGRSDAMTAATLARDSFAKLTDESANRFLSRGKPLDPADRDHLIALRDRYRDWPLDPDPEAALHFRVAGLHRLTFLFERLNWRDETLQTCRDHRTAVEELERRGIATHDERARLHMLERLERVLLADAGRIDEAVAVGRGAIARLEPQAIRHPTLEPLLAGVWGDLGNFLGRAGRLEESREAQEKSIAMLEPLVAAAPLDRSRQKLLFTILYNAAINPAFADDPAARRALLTKLVDAAAAALERFPDDPVDSAKSMFIGLASLASADLAEGRPAEALEKVERRTETARRLAAAHPGERLFADHVISAAVQRFHCVDALGRPGDARAGLDEAESLAMAAFAEEPAVMHRTWVLVEVLAFKAMMEEATGHPAEALALHRRLRDAIRPWVKDDGSPEPFPIKLAMVTAQIDRLEAAPPAPEATASGK